MISERKPQVHRRMARCRVCRAWWSQLAPEVNESLRYTAPELLQHVALAPPGDPEHCPCGGKLEAVDMAAHIASLPPGSETK